MNEANRKRKSTCPAPDAYRLLAWLELPAGKFYRWKKSYGMVREGPRVVPRAHWILPEERATIIEFHDTHPLDGYRTLTFMMIDKVAVSPATTYRVLKAAGLLDRSNPKPSRKGEGFDQPDAPHQRGREKFPGVTPRIISDNGPQFIARDFREFVRQSGMTHVRTSPYYPQSNGKIERLHKTLKVTTFRPRAPRTFDEAIALVTAFVDHYNNRRLHSAIDFVTPVINSWVESKRSSPSVNSDLKPRANVAENCVTRSTSSPESAGRTTLSNPTRSHVVAEPVQGVPA